MSHHWYDLANESQGMTHVGDKESAVLEEYLKNGGVNLNPRELAWCAAFVNSTLAQTGQEGTGKANARSFMQWGEEVSGDPQRGDIAVFSRGNRPEDAWKGHVGFFDSFDDAGNIRVLGGNQANQLSRGDPRSVNISSYDKGRLLGFRRAKALEEALDNGPQKDPFGFGTEWSSEGAPASTTNVALNLDELGTDFARGTNANDIENLRRQPQPTQPRIGYEASYTDAVAKEWEGKGGKDAYIKAAKAWRAKNRG